MNVYKRGAWSFIKSLGIAIFGPLAIGFVVNMFIDDLKLSIIIAAGLFLIMIFMTIFSENIKFETEKNILRYYKKGKLVRTIDLTDCGFSYRVRQGSNTDSIRLTIYPANPAEQELSVDCQPIGTTKFYNMIEDIKVYANEEDNEIQTTKKEV